MGRMSGNRRLTSVQVGSARSAMKISPGRFVMTNLFFGRFGRGSFFERVALRRIVVLHAEQ